MKLRRNLYFYIPIVFFYLCSGVSIDAESDTYGVLVKQSHEYIVATTRLTVERLWADRFDRLIAQKGATLNLGKGWGPLDPRWQQARKGLLKRVATLHAAFIKQGEAERMLDQQLRRSLTTAEAQDLAQRLSGIAGPVYLRQQGAMHYIVGGGGSLRPGTPEWLKQMGESQKEFNAGFSVPTPTPQKIDAKAQQELAALSKLPAATKFGRAFTVSAQTIETKIGGAVNLMLFDQRAAIDKDINAALAKTR